MRTTFIFNSITFILSVITLFRGFFIKKNFSRYFIVNNKNDLIDERSKMYCNKNQLINSINFVHTTNLIIAIEVYFKIPNTIFINSLNYFSEKFSKKLIFIFVNKILENYQVKKHYMIDDYRYLGIFIPICNKLNIKTTGYMHGRISKELKFQESLKNYTFDELYIWSKFFCKELLRINPNYAQRKIIIYNKFKGLKFPKKKKKKRIILFLEESIVPHSFFFKVAKNILIKNHYEIAYKFRPNNNKKNLVIMSYCKKNKIKTFHEGSFESLAVKQNILAIVATNTTALINASYFGVFPICIKSKYSLNLYFKEKIVFPLKMDTNILYQLKKIFNNKKKLHNIKKKLWQKK